MAVDRANHEPMNTGTAGILVKVKDVEDQPPEFSYISPIARVPEDIPVGSNIFQGTVLKFQCRLSFLNSTHFFSS